MVNKPKNIGTATETAVVRYLRANGFPQAERRALAGAVDLGDIVGTPGIVWEVKGGKAAETASDAQIEAWLAETDTERRNAGARLGILVTKRKAVGATRAGDWWAWADLIGDAPDTLGINGYGPEAPRVTARLLLSDVVRLLRWWGYGDEDENAGEVSA